MSDYSIVAADEVEDAYADEDVPGEFRALTDPLGSEQVAVMLMRVPPQTVRSHRNRGDEPVELWAVSRKIEDSDSTKVEDFWEASPEASQG
jgi:hypothetical protein